MIDEYVVMNRTQNGLLDARVLQPIRITSCGFLSNNPNKRAALNVVLVSIFFLFLFCKRTLHALHSVCA